MKTPSCGPIRVAPRTRSEIESMFAKVGASSGRIHSLEASTKSPIDGTELSRLLRFLGYHVAAFTLPNQRAWSGAA